MTVAFVLLAIGLVLHAVALVRDFRRKRRAERRLLEVVTQGWAPEPADAAAALREDLQVAYLDMVYDLPAYEGERS